MSRDTKFSRRGSGKVLKYEETENIPVNTTLRDPSTGPSTGRLSIDFHSRPPLNTIQEPPQNPGNELGMKNPKIFRTPTKPKVVRNQESMRTPDKVMNMGRSCYGWGQDSRDEGRVRNGNGNVTPKPCRIISSSTHSTPTKSVGKGVNLGSVYGGCSKPPVNGGVRTGNFAALSKGIPVGFNGCASVNSVEVPHFDLREDPSFWMDHNVQVLIRVRPLNSKEISEQGYNRCLKQESSQSITWVAQPETRFTFDHIACETIEQETLFKTVGQPMVENCLSGYNSCMFAYGQTGSGKTHTMLGEINDLEKNPSLNRGMTPRIFEFLFARIFAEEENRRDERLKYSCKCSFLEIYNEQITDLLDPSSTNLQLREDVNTGVYVENLTEYEVHCVGDILKLLSQGSANRRVAATNMNRESSRSHSVFTCVIESRWEKDATSNLRFARLNLVDLAGSERQKTSGAEGERLKEAANINKSLSTLGHVIMVLVDGNARTKHVPYRDSRLTFLLQDSLGGNSKTMIIANVSPSISSAIETLNTLKFAQRAKLIQNNAVINEDASGDVVALQHQIRLLKEEVAILKRQNTSRSLTFSSKDENCSNASSIGDDDKVLRISCNQLKSLETSLNGSLRREKSTENCIKQLEAEIEQLNCLVRQREEENRCTKMMLKFREDKIQKMDSVLSGIISADTYLIEENNTLTEEIKILHGKLDRNPEVTRFAVENIRLLEQLKRFQEFIEEGERETLLAEVSELRDQLALVLDENNDKNLRTEQDAAEDKKEIDSLQSELIKSQEELEKCRDNLNSCLEKNTKLCREISDLNALLERQKSSLNDQDGVIEAMKKKDAIYRKCPEEIVCLQLELEFLKNILEGERIIHEKSILKENETEHELIVLREKCEEKEEKLNGLSEEFDLLTNKIEEVLTIGKNALDDASYHGKQTRVSENLQTIARKMSEKDLRIVELNTCLEDAKVRGNEMETMLRSLRGAILVMSEAHQQDCIRKDEELDRLWSELNEKNSIIIQMEEQRKLYEVELIDANINATQHAMESCCYLNAFAEIQHNVKEADLMIKKLVIGDEAMRMEISHLNQVISEKNETLRCLEAAESINLESEKIYVSTVFEKLKEEIIVSYVDMQLKDLILLEKDAEVDLMMKGNKVCEVELMDAMKNTTQQAFESYCYLRKFEETKNMINEAGFMTNHLLNENEAIKIEINELKTKEIDHINEREILMDNCSVLENQLKIDTMRKERTVQVIIEKDDKLRHLEEKLVTDLFAKNIELHIMSSKLEQVASENNELQKDKFIMSKVFDKFKEDIIISYVDLHFKDLSLLEDDTMGVENLVQVISEKDEELRCVEGKLLRDLFAKDMELFMMTSKLEQVASDNRDHLEKDRSIMSEVFEMLKEDIIVSCVDLHFKDFILSEKDTETYLLQEDFKMRDEDKGAQLRFHKEENEKLVMIIKNQKDEIKEFEAGFESLAYEHHENIVKSLVLEAHLTGNVEAALQEKRSAMEMTESLKKDLKSVTCERDDLHVEFLKAKQLYEVELTNAKMKVQEADMIINKLVTENETMQIEIFQQVQLLEAKEIELFIVLSRLVDQVALDNSVYSFFEKVKEKIIISCVDRHFKDYILLETDAEVGALQKVCETSKHVNEEKLKLYEKSLEELESTVNLLENQVRLIKGDAESQRLKNEELELEFQKIYQQKQLLITENESFKGNAESQRLKNEELELEVQKIQKQKQLLIIEYETLKTENANYKKKVTELEDEVQRLLEQQDLEQRIQQLAKIKEENKVLKTQNDEISQKLRQADAIVTRVKEEVANLRVSNRRSPC